MAGLTPEQIDVLARSIALHASGAMGGTGHLGDFPDTKSTDDMSRRIKEMLADPDTQFLVNNSTGKPNSGTVYLFNEKTKSILIFNPNQLNAPNVAGADNLAGTFYREPGQKPDGQQYSRRPPDYRGMTDAQANNSFKDQVKKFKNEIADDLGVDRATYRNSPEATPRPIGQNDEWSRRIANEMPRIQSGYATAVNRQAAAVLNDPNTVGFWTDPEGRTKTYLNEKTNSVVTVGPEGTKVEAFRSLEEARLGFGDKLRHAANAFPNAHKGSIPDVFSGGQAGLADAFKVVRGGGIIGDLKNFVKETGHFLGRATTILGPIGVAYAGYEATNLAIKSYQMAEYGLMPKNALVAYDAMLGGFIAQAAADPTLVGGEVAIQAAYDQWAKSYNISGRVKAELQPGLLINDVKDLIVKAHDVLKGVANNLLEKNAPVIAAIASEVGKNAFERMSNEDKLKLVMKKLGDEMQKGGLPRLLSDNARHVDPSDIGNLNRVFRLSIPIPSITPDLKPPGGIFPSLPSLRDLIPDIRIPRMQIPQFKLFSETDKSLIGNENGQAQLAGIFSQKAFGTDTESLIAKSVTYKDVFDALPTVQARIDELDPTMRNLAEIKSNLSILQVGYQTAQEVGDTQTMEAFSELMTQEVETFRDEIDTIAQNTDMNDWRNTVDTMAMNNTQIQDQNSEAAAVAREYRQGIQAVSRSSYSSSSGSAISL